VAKLQKLNIIINFKFPYKYMEILSAYQMGHDVVLPDTLDANLREYIEIKYGAYFYPLSNVWILPYTSLQNIEQDYYLKNIISVNYETNFELASVSEVPSSPVKPISNFKTKFSADQYTPKVTPRPRNKMQELPPEMTVVTPIPDIKKEISYQHTPKVTQRPRNKMQELPPEMTVVTPRPRNKMQELPPEMTVVTPTPDIKKEISYQHTPKVTPRPRNKMLELPSERKSRVRPMPNIKKELLHQYGPNVTPISGNQTLLTKRTTASSQNYTTSGEAYDVYNTLPMSEPMTVPSIFRQPKLRSRDEQPLFLSRKTPARHLQQPHYSSEFRDIAFDQTETSANFPVGIKEIDRKIVLTLKISNIINLYDTSHYFREILDDPYTFVLFKKTYPFTVMTSFNDFIIFKHLLEKANQHIRKSFDGYYPNVIRRKLIPGEYIHGKKYGNYKVISSSDTEALLQPIDFLGNKLNNSPVFAIKKWDVWHIDNPGKRVVYDPLFAGGILKHDDGPVITNIDDPFLLYLTVPESEISFITLQFGLVCGIVYVALNSNHTFPYVIEDIINSNVILKYIGKNRNDPKFFLGKIPQLLEIKYDTTTSSWISEEYGKVLFSPGKWSSLANRYR
jgi:hypothetical protein